MWKKILFSNFDKKHYTNCLNVESSGGLNMIRLLALVKIYEKHPCDVFVNFVICGF